MGRRIALAGLAGLLAAPAFVIEPAAADVLFTCSSVTGSTTLSPGLTHDKGPQNAFIGAPGEIVLADTSDEGVKANGGSTPSLSADGTKVAFASTGLDPADTDAFTDIYVKDLVTGDITLVSTSDGGIKSNANNFNPTLSRDGTKLAFQSRATNLDPADTNPDDYDIYVKNLVTGDIILASTSDSGVKANHYSLNPELSADGTDVAFESRASNLDPADAADFAVDIYVKDLLTGDIVLASASDAGLKANGESEQASLSADGTKVAFQSDATNLHPKDTESGLDVYVKNVVNGNLKLASTSGAGVKGNEVSWGPAMAGDGANKVAFTSGATNLHPAGRGILVKDLDTGAVTHTGVDGVPISFPSASALAFPSYGNLGEPGADSEVTLWVKDLASGALRWASSSDEGRPANNNEGRYTSSTNVAPSLSADGTTVAFVSDATNLDPGDTDSAYDVYVKHVAPFTTRVDIAGCSHGLTGVLYFASTSSFPSRPVGCPEALGGASGNDYADKTPLLIGDNPSFMIEWSFSDGGNRKSYGIAAVRGGPLGTQWRIKLAIVASPFHDHWWQNKFLPDPGTGTTATKTRFKGTVDLSALDSFDCSGGTSDPLGHVGWVNAGEWVAITR